MSPDEKTDSSHINLPPSIDPPPKIGSCFHFRDEPSLPLPLPLPPLPLPLPLPPHDRHSCKPVPSDSYIDQLKREISSLSDQISQIEEQENKFIQSLYDCAKVDFILVQQYLKYRRLTAFLVSQLPTTTIYLMFVFEIRLYNYAPKIVQQSKQLASTGSTGIFTLLKRFIREFEKCSL